MSNCLVNNKSVQKGFTLLELMVTIAIVGILATVSYGVYQQYIAKSKVTDLVFRIDAMRTAFAVLEASDGIPDFNNKVVGAVPLELSQLAITDDDLKYPELTLALIKLGPIGRPSKPYLQVVGWGEKGQVEVKALSNDLAKGQFIWLAEPSIALVPMLGSLTADDILYFNPSPASTVTPPIPTSSVTQVTTPVVTSTTVSVISPWKSPAKLDTAKQQLALLEIFLDSITMPASARSKLRQNLREAHLQMGNDDPSASANAIGTFENNLDDMIQADRSNQQYVALLDGLIKRGREFNNALYDATQATP